jgi:hypothetical protein
MVHSDVEGMQIKGSAVASTLRAIERLHGPAGGLAVRSALPPHLRAMLENDPVLPMRWYPVELVASLHVAVRDVVGQGKWTASHALGITAAREDFSNLYAVIIRMLDATTAWSRMERMWTLYNSRGRFEWLELKPGAMHAIIRDVWGYNDGMWQAVAGRGQQLMTMTGARGADIRVVCSAPTEAEFEGMWLE